MAKNGKKKLLIVESPTKAKTLSKYLGRNFSVIASKGHIRDLPPNRFGVKIDEEGFKPSYVIMKEKRDVVKEIKEAAKKASEIYIGSDPDREGEAIAYHISHIIKRIKKPEEIKRVLFFEITKDAVKDAIKRPGTIDLNKFNAQQARRILDRIVGYKVSPLLWKSVKKGLSAGRVQTVALRFIVEREKEIRNFKPEIYYVVKAVFEKDGVQFTGTLIKGPDGKSLQKIKDKNQAEEIVKKLKEGLFTVAEFSKRTRKQTPPPPYKTSTLQQDASSKLGYAPRRTMKIAQELYEGVDLGGERRGLITYMRTDSLRMSEKAIEKIREIIKENFGEEFLSSKPRQFKSKGSAVQGAHEAIRPTGFDFPESIRSFLTREQHSLYSLIWKRAVASQAKEAQFEVRKAILENSGYRFKAEGETLKFEGFYKITGEKPREVEIPVMKVGEQVKLVDLKMEKKQTEPPKRYTEATLIKTLEAKEIGRPSTYAPTISTLFERGYIEKDGKFLKPTELGELVNDILIPRFKEIFDYGFTAKMEDELDKVELGELSWQDLLREFYDHFKKEFEKAQEDIPAIKKENVEVLDEKCPLCGRPLVIRWGRYGKFIACSGYPECKYTRPLEQEIVEGEKCPVCGKPMVIRKGKYGRFLACIDYPKCPGVKPLSTGVKCPECGGDIVERVNKRGKVFYACSNYPKCKFTLPYKPVPVECPNCGYPLLMEVHRGKKFYYQCPNCKKTFSPKEIGLKLEKSKK